MEAQLHADLARAHEAYARGVLALAGGMAETSVPELRGRVQKRIVGLPEMFTTAGMSAGEIARRLDYDEANTYASLKTLTDAQVVEEVPGEKPRRWRIEDEHRKSRVLRLSRLIPDGQWTTYGDFSIAVYGTSKMAKTIGRVAAKNSAFANPHRVLWSGGVIKDGWQDDEGRGPEECERRLAADGIEITDRVADKAKFIDWEQLQALLDRDDEITRIDEAA